MNTENKSCKINSSCYHQNQSKSTNVDNCKKSNPTSDKSMCEFLKSQPTPEWANKSQKSECISCNLKKEHDISKPPNDNLKNTKKCRLSVCKSKKSSNNNVNSENKCKTNKEPITKQTEFCDYLKSQPIPEWIKSIKDNSKRATDDSPKTVEHSNDIISPCNHVNPVTDSVLNCKNIQKATTKCEDLQKPVADISKCKNLQKPATNSSTCKNVQKLVSENVKPAECPSVARKNGAGVSSCPCKGLGKFHDSRFKNDVVKPLDDRSAGWGLADWDLVDWGITDNEKKKVPEHDVIKSTSCTNYQKTAVENVSSCKNIQEPAAENVNPTECPLTARKDNVSGKGCPCMSAGAVHDSQHKNQVYKPLDHTKSSSCNTGQRPATDYVSKCKNSHKPAVSEQFSSCKNVQKPFVGCPAAAGKNVAGRSDCLCKGTKITHDINSRHRHHVDKSLDHTKSSNDQKPATYYASKCKKLADCSSITYKIDDRNGELTSRGWCAHRRNSECSAVAMSPTPNSWNRKHTSNLRRTTDSVYLPSLIRERSPDEFVRTPRGLKCPSFQPTRPCECRRHSSFDTRRRRF